VQISLGGSRACVTMSLTPRWFRSGWPSETSKTGSWLPTRSWTLVVTPHDSCSFDLCQILFSFECTGTLLYGIHQGIIKDVHWFIVYENAPSKGIIKDVHWFIVYENAPSNPVVWFIIYKNALSNPAAMRGEPPSREYKRPPKF
jgi:hypothetical protein